MSEFNNMEVVMDYESLNGLKKVALLKKIEKISEIIFRKNHMSKLSKSDQEKVERVVFQSDLAGIEEFSSEWYMLISMKMIRMKCCRCYCKDAIEKLGDASGFTQFEREIIIGSANVSNFYDDYYFAYLKSVQDKVICTQMAHSPPTTSDEACYSHYTTILLGKENEYTTVAFGEYFKDVLKPILQSMDDMLCKLRAIENLTNENNSYITYFQWYRHCLNANADAATLEAMWAELDRKWMDTKGSIQIVHDIETGYGDPLRIKATPDFSIRFLDDTYDEENKTIASIQSLMMDYFSNRNTVISNNSLTALGNTMAGIYYIPFKTGISLQFSFSGQSIPNRQDVSTEKGVKIYFDAVETMARVKLNEGLVMKVFKDPQGVLDTYKPDAVEQLVWHVAAHEVGHAIYNLASIDLKEYPAVAAMLEEPRAELTAMFTLNLLHKEGRLTLPHLKECLVHFALDALRYFAKFKSEPLRPYIIFQIYAYKTYMKHGFLISNNTSDSNKTVEMSINTDSTLEVLSEFSELYLKILKCEDNGDGAQLQSILDDMMIENDTIQNIVKMLC